MMTSGPGYTNVMQAAGEGRLPFVQRVYGLFLAGILVSVAAAAAVLGGPQQQIGDLSVPMRVLGVVENYGGVVIGFFVTFFLASALRRKPVINLLLMFLFTAMSGVMIAPRLWLATAVDAPGTLPMAGALTTIMFVTLSVYAMLSKRSFNYLGAGLTVALVGLILGGLLNGFFFHSPLAYMVMAWGALVIFSGFVLYDTHLILTRLSDDEYIIGALNLYLDFINLFLAILRILGGSRR